VLVLGRYVEESILIAGAIRVTVVEVRQNGYVRLGFEAPKHINIVREELLEAQHGSIDSC